jgi:hypothetical protein
MVRIRVGNHRYNLTIRGYHLRQSFVSRFHNAYDKVSLLDLTDINNE